ncbi:MAG: mechanosensitive ion channel family protein, partial [Verrucomicrobia bacterium]|nr:mechanosensitive ion channel family protein [Verrucomicrobiota bacterium]
MNHAMLPVLLEGSLLLGIYLLAILATSPFRTRVEGESRKDLSAGLRSFLRLTARPLAVLIISNVVIQLLRLNDGAATWLEGHPKHAAAWLTFWLVVLALGVIEAVIQLGFRLRDKPFRIPQLMRNIARGLILLLAAFAILKYQLGINISPLLASTALVTAVVGFALQGVLGNLLGGMSLHVVGSVMPGDWVAIGDTEGEVIETNWRETRLRTVAGHIMIIPNSTVASSVVHNMTRPTPLRRHAVHVGASYSDAPGEVLEALLESAHAVPEVLREPEP